VDVRLDPVLQLLIASCFRVGVRTGSQYGNKLPGNCPASLPPPAAHLWKTFRSKLNAIPVDEQNCSPSHRNRVHLQPGIAFTFDRIPHRSKTGMTSRDSSPAGCPPYLRPDQNSVCSDCMSRG
jgi:hypothetical protein